MLHGVLTLNDSVLLFFLHFLSLFLPPSSSCVPFIHSPSYYLKAQSLAPKDGKPYNQLAVVALNAVSPDFSVYLSNFLTPPSAPSPLIPATVYTGNLTVPYLHPNLSSIDKC